MSGQSVAETLRIGRETAEGLAAAHARGLLHRDIKPANLWLEAPRGRVKILDFGLARSVVDDLHLTQSGTIVGTPSYMAPEQAGGKTIDQRADLFSLGCVLYRMCTGQDPFLGATSFAVLEALARDTPVAPRLRNPEVPADVSAFIMKLLAKDPAHRPASAEAVANELDRLQKATTVSPALRRTIGALPPPRLWPWLMLAAAAVIGALVLFARFVIDHLAR